MASHVRNPIFQPYRSTRMRYGMCIVNILEEFAWWRQQIFFSTHFMHYWPFVRRIHQSTVDSPHKGQCCGALMFSLVCTWTNVWANNWDAGDLRCHCTQYDVTVREHVITGSQFASWYKHIHTILYYLYPILSLSIITLVKFMHKPHKNNDWPPIVMQLTISMRVKHATRTSQKWAINTV